jgi:predicted MFS family arabinose efflux permease
MGVTRRAHLGAPFWRLWLATLTSSSGDGLVVVAVPLLALSLTRDTVAIAGVTVVSAAARTVVSLPAGVVADRFPRRRVMVVCSLASLTALAVLVADLAAGGGDLAVVYVVAAGLAVSDATYALSVQGFVALLVPEQSLPLAFGRLLSADYAGEMCVGTTAGGLLFSVARAVPFVGDAASFVLASVLSRFGLPPGQPAVGPPTRTWRQDLAEGVGLYRRHRLLQVLTANVATFSFCQNAVYALLVVYARRELHLGPGGYGLFFAVASGLAVTGAFFGGVVVRRFGAGAVLLAAGVVTGADFVGLALSRSVVPATVVLGAGFMMVSVANVASVTTRQRLVPPHLYSRAASVHRLFVNGAAPIGALAGGLVASAYGVPTDFALIGGLQLVAAVLIGPPLWRHVAAVAAA